MHWDPLGRPGRGGAAAGVDARARRASSADRGRARPRWLTSASPTPLADDLLDGLRARSSAPSTCNTDHETRVRHTRREVDARPAEDVARATGRTRPTSWCARRTTTRWRRSWSPGAGSEHVALVPFGGGSRVVGGLGARRDGYAGVVSLDLRRLARLVAVDAESATAVLERRTARARRPRRCSRSTARRWVTSRSRSSTPRSAGSRPPAPAARRRLGLRPLRRAGRRADRRHPAATLTLGSAPANAAGPDLRQLVLGSEGAFGVITSVTVRVRPVPATKVVRRVAVRLVHRRCGRAAALTQAGPAADGAPALRRERDRGEPGDARRRSAPSRRRCLIIAGYEGTRSRRGAPRRDPARLEVGRRHTPGEETGQAWAAGRFHGPYLRDSLLDSGVLVETLETATFWSNLPRLDADGHRRAHRFAAADAAAGALPRLPRLRDGCLAVLHRRRRQRDDAGPVGRPTRPRPRRPSSRRRDDHAPSRRRPRPPALARRRDRPGRRRDAARGQASGSTRRRGCSTRACSSPTTATEPPHVDAEKSLPLNKRCSRPGAQRQ